MQTGRTQKSNESKVGAGKRTIGESSTNPPLILLDKELSLLYA
jgi:hypothetical protein